MKATQQPQGAITQGQTQTVNYPAYSVTCPPLNPSVYISSQQSPVQGGTTTVVSSSTSLYPSLNDEYMGLQLTQYRPPGAVVPAGSTSSADRMVAPVSGSGNVGLKRAEIKPGVWCVCVGVCVGGCGSCSCMSCICGIKHSV